MAKTSEPKAARGTSLKAPADHKNKAVSIEVTSAEPAAFAAAVARKLTRPEVSAAAVIESWQKDTHDVNQLVAALAHEVGEVNAGNLARAEAMLISQAHALDNIFSNLARRATNQEYLKQWDAYMRMAMKAQSQCRMTLETLANIKNPPTVFARQANINNGGQQQVNNGAQGAAPTPHSAFSGQNAWARARAGNEGSKPSELLEANDGQRMDAGAPRAAGAGYSRMATMGKVNRPSNR